MSRINDHWLSGYDALQDFSFKKRKVPMDLRAANMACRVIDREDNDLDLGHYIYDRESVGDVIGGLLWKEQPSNGLPAVRTGPRAFRGGAADLPERLIPAWAYAWPTMIQSSKLVAKKPAGTRFGGRFANANGSDPFDNKLFIDPRLRGADRVMTSSTQVRPLVNEFYDPDPRFRQKSSNLPCEWPRFAAGHIGILLDATKEDEQIELFISGDPRLSAINFAGEPNTASVVTDGEYDLNRYARLHSIFRVVRPRGKCGRVNFNIKDKTSPDDCPKIRRIDDQLNLIARQYGSSGQDEIGGYGLIYDNVPGPPLKKCKDDGGPPPPPGRGGNRTTAPPRNRSTDETITDPRQKKRRLNQPNLHRVGSKGLIAAMGKQLGGPIDVGDAFCQHRIFKTADGEIGNSAHISTDALYRGVVGDGPILFDDKCWEDPGPLPHRARTHLRWDPDDTHDHCSGRKKGKWKYISETLIYIPDTDIRRRSIPPPIKKPVPHVEKRSTTTTTTGGGVTTTPPTGDRSTTKQPGPNTGPLPSGQVQTPIPPNFPSAFPGGSPPVPPLPSSPPVPPLPTGPPVPPLPGPSFPAVASIGLPESDPVITNDPRLPRIANGEPLPAFPPLPVEARGDVITRDPRLPSIAGEPFPAFPATPENISWPPQGAPPLIGDDKMVRRTLPGEPHKPFGAMTMDMSMPALMFRPQLTGPREPDLRSNPKSSPSSIASHDARSPVVMRMESWTGIEGNRPVYTQKPSTGKWRGGSAPGGVLVMPPETDILDAVDNFSPFDIATSPTFFAATCGAFLGVGKPNTSNGLLKDGHSWGLDPSISGESTIDALDPDGVRLEILRYTQSGVEFTQPVCISETVTTVPGLEGCDDPNTGIAWIGSDELEFINGGNRSAAFLSTGFLSIEQGIQILDNISMIFGTGVGDVQIQSNGTDLTIFAPAGTPVINTSIPIRLDNNVATQYGTVTNGVAEIETNGTDLLISRVAALLPNLVTDLAFVVQDTTDEYSQFGPAYPGTPIDGLNRLTATQVRTTTDAGTIASLVGSVDLKIASGINSGNSIGVLGENWLTGIATDTPTYSQINAGFFSNNGFGPGTTFAPVITFTVGVGGQGFAEFSGDQPSIVDSHDFFGFGTDLSLANNSAQLTGIATNFFGQAHINGGTNTIDHAVGIVLEEQTFGNNFNTSIGIQGDGVIEFGFIKNSLASERINADLAGGALLLTGDNEVAVIADQFSTAAAGRKKSITNIVGAGGTTVLLETDHIILVDTAANGQTITLPAPGTVGSGSEYTVMDVSGDAFTNNIIVENNAAETINGATTFTLDNAFQSATFVTDGTDWTATSEATSSKIKFKTITLESPSNNDDIGLDFFKKAITIQCVRGVIFTNQPSPNYDFNLVFATSRNAAGTNVFASDQQITSETTGDTFTTFADNTIPVDNFLWLTSTSAVKANQVTIVVEYTEDVV